jgi:hypothetical protein
MGPRTDERRFAVLSVSDDDLVRSTRERILQLLGLEVLSCASKDAGSHLKDRRFDLVVLGHSLKFDAPAKIAEEARRHSPDARVLLLERTPYEVTHSDFADVITVPDAPIVVREVRALLGMDGNGRAPAKGAAPQAD